MVELTQLAEQQWGVLGRKQVEGLGVGPAAISRWVREGRLQRIHSGVYVLGHRVLTVEGRLFAALMHAAPRAALSHTTAAWWRGLLTAKPRVLHVQSGT